MAPLTLRQQASQQSLQQALQEERQQARQQQQQGRDPTDGWDEEAGRSHGPLMTVPELLDVHPQHLVRFVKESGMRRLGTLHVRDLSVLSRFANAPGLLTLGSNDADLDWETAWQRELKLLPLTAPATSTDPAAATSATGSDADLPLLPKTAQQPDGHEPQAMWGYLRELVNNRSLAPALATAGWAQEVALQAYVVNLRDPAAPGEQGLLHPLLARWLSGTCTLQVFGLPAVQAVITFKWQFFAKRLLFIELALYMLWLVAFTASMMLMQTENPAKPLSATPKGMLALLCEALAWVGMLPFVFIEGCTIAVHRANWLSLWNMVDVTTYGLQAAITVMHLGRIGGAGLTICVALQCILLMVRLQYFLRAFRSTSFDFVGGLQAVLQDVRWYLGLMLLLMWGFACAFYALFRGQDPQFATLAMSVLSMFSYAVGGATYYLDSMGKSQSPITATLLVIAYQLVVSMVLMSLLIGVITNSLAKVTANEQLCFLQSRVELIDELEAVLPHWLVQRWNRGGGRPRYIYVLRVDPKSIDKVEQHYLWNAPSAMDAGKEAAEREEHVQEELERAWQEHETEDAEQPQAEPASLTNRLSGGAAAIGHAVQQLLGSRSSSLVSNGQHRAAGAGSSLKERIRHLESEVSLLHSKLDKVLALLGDASNVTAA